MNQATNQVVEMPVKERDTDPIQQLLDDLRASEELSSTAGGVRLMARVENALVAQGRGASQIMNVQAMRAYIDFGEFVSRGKATLPDHLKDNPADCTAIAIRADRWGLDFYGVAEKTNIINGKLGYEGQLVGAILVNMGAIKEKALRDEYIGGEKWNKILGKFREVESKTQKDKHGHPSKYKIPAWDPKDEEGLGIRVWGTLPGETEPREIEVLMTQALVRNSGLWATDPKLQLYYLAERKWARKYAPGALLGVYTPEELEEVAPPRHMGAADVVEPKERPGLPDEDLKKWRAAAGKGLEAAAAHWKAMPLEKRQLATEAQRQEMREIADKADKNRTVDNATTATPPAEPDAAADAHPVKEAVAATILADAAQKIDDDFTAAYEKAEGKA